MISTVSVISVTTYPDWLENSILKESVTTASKLRLEATQLRKKAAYLEELANAEDAQINQHYLIHTVLVVDHVFTTFS